jgi:hypothetical protein
VGRESCISSIQPLVWRMGNRLGVGKRHCALWEDTNVKLSSIRSGVS